MWILKNKVIIVWKKFPSPNTPNKTLFNVNREEFQHLPSHGKIWRTKFKPMQEELAKIFQSVKTGTKGSFKKEEPNNASLNIVNEIHFHNMWHNIVICKVGQTKY